MDIKRSKGVTFWGWVFIVSGALGLLGVIKPLQTIKFYGIGIFYFGLILSAVNLICGIFILKLKENARKTVIILGVVSILLIPIYLKLIFKQLNFEYYYNKKRQVIVEQIKPEYQQKALENLEKVRKVNDKALPIIFVLLFGMPLLIIELLPIYFFTRPKVKEQFNRVVDVLQ